MGTADYFRLIPVVAVSPILLSDTRLAASESVILHLHNGDRIRALVEENEAEITVMVYGSAQSLRH